ncbi:MFS transporter [Hydrogenophaga sp. OTU3427]|uniref:MFS transporter n=1 Tax=Hydrogenophaga sp. OTU3427 TaxID=3043856 RepID=UPI00313B1F8B
MSSPTPQAVAPATSDHPSVRGVLVALSVAMLMTSLGTSIANVALPTLTQVFTAPFQAVQWVVIAYLLTITALVTTVGRLGDLLGRRRLLLLGLVIFTLASLAGGASVSLWQLIAARVGQGVGAALMMALAMALVSEVVPKDKAGGAMGLLGTVSAVGTALGPTLGGLLIGAVGWQAVFWINLPLGAVAFVLAHRHLSPDRLPAEPGKVRFDPLGTVLLTLSLTAYALSMTLGQGRFGALHIGLLLTAALGAGAFVVAEGRVAAPLVRPALFRHPVTGTGFVTSALVTTVVMATLVVGPFYLGGVLGLDAVRTGLVMSVGPAVAAIAGLPAGRWVDRVGPHQVGLAGLATMLAGTAALPTASSAWGVAGYAGTLALITSGYAAFQAANNTTVMASASPDQRGLVSGLLNLARNLGLITGASVMGAVFHAGASTRQIATADPQALAAGLGLTFLVAAAAVATAVVLALVGLAAARRAAPIDHAQATRHA